MPAGATYTRLLGSVLAGADQSAVLASLVARWQDSHSCILAQYFETRASPRLLTCYCNLPAVCRGVCQQYAACLPIGAAVLEISFKGMRLTVLRDLDFISCNSLKCSKLFPTSIRNGLRIFVSRSAAIVCKISGQMTLKYRL